MPKHLQLSVDATELGLPIHITPLDIALPDSAGAAAELLIAALDAGDAVPGDGVVEEAVDAKIPVKINFSIIHLNQTIDVQGTAKLAIVDHA